MIVFNQEGLSAVPEIVGQLASANFQESGLLQDHLELNVNVEAYHKDFTEIFTVRNDGDLVGYAVFLVVEHPHFKGTTFAMNDVVYIKPEYRLVSTEFFKFIEENLAVDVINFSMNYTQPHMKLMQSLGFEPTEIVYHKVVRNG